MIQFSLNNESSVGKRREIEALFDRPSGCLRAELREREDQAETCSCAKEEEEDEEESHPSVETGSRAEDAWIKLTITKRDDRRMYEPAMMIKLHN